MIVRVRPQNSLGRNILQWVKKESPLIVDVTNTTHQRTICDKLKLRDGFYISNNKYFYFRSWEPAYLHVTRLKTHTASENLQSLDYKKHAIKAATLLNDKYTLIEKRYTI